MQAFARLSACWLLASPVFALAIGVSERVAGQSINPDSGKITRTDPPSSRAPRRAALTVEGGGSVSARSAPDHQASETDGS